MGGGHTHWHTQMQEFKYMSTHRQKETTWWQSTFLRGFYLLKQWEGREGGGVVVTENRSFCWVLFLNQQGEELTLTVDTFSLVFLHSLPSCLFPVFPIFFSSTSVIRKDFISFTSSRIINFHLRMQFFVNARVYALFLTVSHRFWRGPEPTSTASLMPVWAEWTTGQQTDGPGWEWYSEVRKRWGVK